MNKKIEKLLNNAKSKGYITECDKSRILTMAERDNINYSIIEKFLNTVKIKASRTAIFNRDLLPQLVSFEEVKALLSKQKQPILINTYGGESPFPFSVEMVDNNLLLKGNEQNKKPSQYILTEDKWKSFCKYVKEHPEMCRGELGDNFKEYGCDNKKYWPAIISISKVCK